MKIKKLIKQIQIVFLYQQLMSILDQLMILLIIRLILFNYDQQYNKLLNNQEIYIKFLLFLMLLKLKSIHQNQIILFRCQNQYQCILKCIIIAEDIIKATQLVKLKNLLIVGITGANSQQEYFAKSQTKVQITTSTDLDDSAPNLFKLPKFLKSMILYLSKYTCFKQFDN
ncbi:unnamed protein product [Paramecium sonneborni]|uniref:Uncharacterized protein n=1 Tax=Paramecium sonneborni TaxID=65129 RepID=A0A8S1QLU6_9CILI|nr:unnamed protein product [Paramecium sonneborni]